MDNKEKEQTIENKEQTKKSNPKLLIFNIIFIIAVLVGVFIYMMNEDGAEHIGEVLGTANHLWMVIGFVFLIMMWLAETINLHIPLKKLYPTQKFTNTLKITMIGQLFNNLTPFSTGGQVMQVYEMNRSGKRTSDSLSILTMKFLVQQITMMLLSLVFIIFQFTYFRQVFQNYIAIGIIGLCINIGMMIMLILIGTKKELIMNVARPVIRFISKIKIGRIQFIKNPEEKLEKFDQSVINFNKQFKMMKDHPKVVAQMAVAGMIQAIMYYAITYAVYKTFGNSGTSLPQIVILQTFLMLLVNIVPTPGAGLGAEGGFILIFGPIFREGTINIATLFWRMYTFYMPMLIGVLFMIPTKRNRTERKESWDKTE